MPLIIIGLLLLIGSSWAVEKTNSLGNDLQVSCSLDRAKILAGEPITLKVHMQWRQPVQVPSVVVSEEKIGEFRVLSTKSSRDYDLKGYQQRDVTIQVTSFAIGKNQLPSIPIPYTDMAGKILEVKTPSFPVEVASYLKQLATGEKTPPRPMKPPIYWSLSKRVIILIAASIFLSLVFLSLAIWHIRRHRLQHPRVISSPPPLPPDEEALRALSDLELSGMIDREGAKAYYIRLSEILRRYLGRRYEFDALEMTSSELLEKSRILSLDNGVFQSLQDDAVESDSVKFAQYIPTRPKREAALRRVRQIVTDTRPAPDSNIAPGTPPTETITESQTA